MFQRACIFLSLFCMFCACSGVKDAQQTVAVADSLRVNHGVAYANGVPANNVQRGVGDSLALAEAYVTTGKWRYIYPDDYARACYYYGRLLRFRNDQVSAMRAFIAGTHAPYVQRLIPLPWFNDYHILGRIYSNMGTLCHIDDEFQISCDMYEQSAANFLKAKDSLMYHCAELSKIFEIIELQKEDSALAMLADIERTRQDEYVLSLANLIRGYAYRNKCEYDTAIYYANLVAPAYHDPAWLTLKAQCFASVERWDSAVYFADLIMKHPAAPIQNRYNVAYIIIHADAALTDTAKDSLIDYRSDLGVMRREEKSALSHAVEILQLDLQNELSDTEKILCIVAIILLPVLVFFLIRYLYKLLHRLRAEASVRQEVMQQYEIHQNKRLHELEKTCKRLRAADDLKAELHWSEYKEMCAQVDLLFDNFTKYLLQDYQLNETEIRLCILVIIDLPQKQIARIMPCAESSVKTTKKRTAKKIGTDGKNMRNYLLKYVIGDMK